MTKTNNKKIKYNLFKWTKARQKAFDDLKQTFTKIPVLAHCDPTLETWMETDASDFVIGGVLS